MLLWCSWWIFFSCTKPTGSDLVVFSALPWSDHMLCPNKGCTQTLFSPSATLARSHTPNNKLPRQELSEKFSYVIQKGFYDLKLLGKRGLLLAKYLFLKFLQLIIVLVFSFSLHHKTFRHLLGFFQTWGQKGSCRHSLGLKGIGKMAKKIRMAFWGLQTGQKLTVTLPLSHTSILTNPKGSGISQDTSGISPENRAEISIRFHKFLS